MPTPAIAKVEAARSVPRAADVLVIGVTSNESKSAKLSLVGAPTALTRAASKTFGAPLPEFAANLGASASAGSTAVLPHPTAGMRLIAVGLGADGSLEDLRTAAASAVRAAGGLGDGLKVALSLGTDEPETVRAAAEGAVLGQYNYEKISGADATGGLAGVSVVTDPKQHGEVVTGAAIVAAAQVQACDWVNVPPNLLYPETFAAEAKAMAKELKLDVEVLDEAQLEAGGYGGLLAVGGGSSRGPRLARISYRPRGADAHLVLVGKGITFDSGGLNIKPGASMLTMKCDMGGAAAVLGAVKAIAQLGLKVTVTAYAAMAENLPSSTAYRPSDVLTMFGGKTVENVNSDAEGRLVMADALARANSDSADLVVDVATLTGACVVALGEQTFGVFSDSEAVSDRLLAAAETAGESAWPMPVPRWAREGLESKVADLKSSGSRAGGAQSAAAFLREFVDEGTDWGHLDIAGPAFNEGSAHGAVPAGGTGVAVRTLVELARSLQKK